MSPKYLFIVFICMGFISQIMGDIYMQSPRGNNDRLNENGDRNNGNRLFNSENNARGGYCWGPEMTYYAGSILAVEWTNQHSCGNDNTHCNIVLQYMCSDDSDTADVTQIIRDGLTTNTIPTGATNASGTNYFNYKNPDFKDGSYFQYGMNEPFSYYQACTKRSRNKGLFTADQNPSNNNGAMATRQNPGATRYGFECTEEHDYYPYWHPSPWKDIAVLTNNKDNCGLYQSQSQNVASKNFCNGTDTQMAANNQRECTEGGGTWVTVPSWGIGKPDCAKAPWTRDNHLGNGVDGHTASYNWTIPGNEPCIGKSCACVLRIRYNITIGEVTFNMDSRNNSNNSPVKGNPTVPFAGNNFTLAINTQQTGRVFQDRSYMFRIIPRPGGLPDTSKIYNLNVRGKRGNIVQTYPATEYDFVPTHLEVNQNDYIHFQWTGCDTNPAGNAGEGKTSTDRSNIVQIADMSRTYPMKDTELNSKNALFTDLATRTRMAMIDQVNCLNATDLTKKSNNVNQDDQNCYKLNAAPTPYFNGGLVKMSNLGTYTYMSSRNNNFSNRAQKAAIVVKNPWPAWKTAAIVVGGVAGIGIGAAAATVFYAHKNPHSRPAMFLKTVPGIKNIV